MTTKRWLLLITQLVGTSALPLEPSLNGDLRNFISDQRPIEIENRNIYDNMTISSHSLSFYPSVPPSVYSIDTNTEYRSNPLEVKYEAVPSSSSASSDSVRPSNALTISLAPSDSSYPSAAPSKSRKKASLTPDPRPPTYAPSRTPSKSPKKSKKDCKTKTKKQKSEKSSTEAKIKKERIHSLDSSSTTVFKSLSESVSPSVLSDNDDYDYTYYDNETGDEECYQSSTVPSLSLVPSESSSPSTVPSLSLAPSDSSLPSTVPSLSSAPSDSSSPSAATTKSPENVSSTPSASRPPTYVPTTKPPPKTVLPTDIRTISGSYKYEMETVANLTLIDRSSDSALLERSSDQPSHDSLLSLLADSIEEDLLNAVKNEMLLLQNENRTLTSTTENETQIEVDVEISHQRRLNDDRFALRCVDLIVKNETASICYAISAIFEVQILGSIGISRSEAGTLALTVIRDSMGDIDRKEEGLLDMAFKGGSIDGFDDLYIPQPTNIPKAQQPLDEYKQTSISKFGYVLIVIMFILIAAFILTISRTKKNYDTIVKETIYDEYPLIPKNLSDTGLNPDSSSSRISIDQTSIIPGNFKRTVYVIGEDDSTLSVPLDEDEFHIDELATEQQQNIQIQADNRLDVHKCPSSTCIVCSKEGPKMLGLDELGPSHNEHQRFEMKQPGSIQNENSTWLKEIDQANIESRSYQIPDTVDI